MLLLRPAEDPDIPEDKFQDIYSYAILLWEIMERQEAWKGIEYGDIERKVLDGVRPPISSDIKTSKEKSIQKIVEVMMAAWTNQPLSRPT